MPVPRAVTITNCSTPDDAATLTRRMAASPSIRLGAPTSKGWLSAAPMAETTCVTSARMATVHEPSLSRQVKGLHASYYVSGVKGMICRSNEYLCRVTIHSLRWHMVSWLLVQGSDIYQDSQGACLEWTGGCVPLLIDRYMIVFAASCYRCVLAIVYSPLYLSTSTNFRS